MSTEQRMDDAELHAWLDGELDAEAARTVEAWLADNPEDARRVEMWRADKEALGAIAADVLDEPVPAHMIQALEAASGASAPARSGAEGGAPQRVQRATAGWLQAAAALALFVAGGAAGYWIAGTLPSAPGNREVVFIDQAVGAHVVFTRERRHPVEVWANKEERHLVRWLSTRVGRQLNPPSLDEAGFKLVGGRLVADHGGPAALFMYQDAAKRRLTLYVRSVRGEKNVAFRVAESRGVSAFYWIEKPFAYALVGKADRQEMLRLGRIVFDGLNAAAK